eukprot:2575495-Karenia_brevis.AAC.1
MANPFWKHIYADHVCAPREPPPGGFKGRLWGRELTRVAEARPRQLRLQQQQQPTGLKLRVHHQPPGALLPQAKVGLARIGATPQQQSQNSSQAQEQ